MPEDRDPRVEVDDDDLVLSVDEIEDIRDRFEAEHSDGGSTGRSDNNDRTPSR